MNQRITDHAVSTTFFNPLTLISYTGGGYDGCISELNYCFFDEEGNFHDIYSSGYFGCPTLERLQIAFDDSKRFDCYNFKKATERKRFADREPARSVLHVAKWLFDQEFFDLKLLPRCSDCGKRFDACTGTGTAIRCVGGIEIQATNLVCPVCACAYTCDCCHEFYGSSHNFQEAEHYGRVCTYCAEEQKESHDASQRRPV